MEFRGKKVAIIGLGIEGRDALRFLVEEGAEVVVFDKKEKEELDTSDVSSISFKLVCGEDYLRNRLAGFDIIVRSPGVRPDLPEIKEAVKTGARLTSAINIFFSLSPAKIIGVTGTKGKGTTATLIYESLKASGKSVYLAGNIGTPYLELLDHLNENDIVVLELSSFQLIDINKSPHIAVVLNITTDHLDWHSTREEYVWAKCNIVKLQNKNDYAVLAWDYGDPRAMGGLTKGRVYYFTAKQETSSAYFSTKEEVEGAYVREREIILKVGEVWEVGEVDKLLLRGEHNWENVTAAAVAAKLGGATRDGIKKAVFSFRGLPHRLELVGTYKGVTFYNDSFATSPLPSLAAVRAFDEPVIIILGGSRKGFSYTDFGRDLSSQKNLKAVLVIGETGPEIKKSLEDEGFVGVIREGGENMKEIVRSCFRMARAGDVVILSPAAASFDMFKDYKDRGQQFKEWVRHLSRIS